MPKSRHTRRSRSASRNTHYNRREKSRRYAGSSSTQYTVKRSKRRGRHTSKPHPDRSTYDAEKYTNTSTGKSAMRKPIRRRSDRRKSDGRRSNRRKSNGRKSDIRDPNRRKSTTRHPDRRNSKKIESRLSRSETDDLSYCILQRI